MLERKNSCAMGRNAPIVQEYSFAAQSEISHLRRFQLQLKLICNQRNKFGIRGFSPKKDVGATIGRPLAAILAQGWRAANGRPYKMD